MSELERSELDYDLGTCDTPNCDRPATVMSHGIRTSRAHCDQCRAAYIAGTEDRDIWLRGYSVHESGGDPEEVR